jgi:hypothetical protein
LASVLEEVKADYKAGRTRDADPTSLSLGRPY